MGATQQVNFRADSFYYQQTKELLAGESMTVSDVLNATLRKIATGAIDAQEFVTKDSREDSNKIAFEELKKEILLGHQDILAGKTSSLVAVRKEFGLDC